MQFSSIKTTYPICVRCFCFTLIGRIAPLGQTSPQTVQSKLQNPFSKLTVGCITPAKPYSMKNHMGIVWDRGFFHQNDLQQCIADICTLQKKAALNVVDAYRIMKTNGPRGRSASDVVLAKGLFISPDIVAVDTAAAKFFNQVREMPLDTVGHLAKGEALKVGTMNLDKLNVKRIKM